MISFSGFIAVYTAVTFTKEYDLTATEVVRGNEPFLTNRKQFKYTGCPICGEHF
jgi:hypothetical protein